MAKGHTRFKDHFGSTTYTPVNEPGDAGQFGGGSTDRAGAEKEAREATKEYDRQDQQEQKQQP